MVDDRGERTDVDGGSLRWLGDGRFWLIAGGLVLLTIAIRLIQLSRVARADAVVAVVSLSGPSEAHAGETLRYSVLVRDRWGAAMPRVRVRVGFEHRGLRELGRGETGEGGDAAVEVKYPAD